MKIKFFAIFILIISLIVSSCNRGSQAPVRGQEQVPQFKTGFNLMSPQQDIEIGRQNAAQVEREMRILPDPAVQNYLNNIGKKLAAVAPGEKFPYQFKVVVVKEINAFALPGGFLYVHTGAIAAAKNESELVGVMAHEIAHSALRHGTHQMTQQMVAEKGLGIATAILNGGERGGLGDAVLGTAASGGLNLLLLKFSRTAEKQADITGAAMMASAGYDPRGLGSFFKTLLADGPRQPQIISDHPDPGNRIQYLNDLLPKLKLAANPIVDTPEFQEVRARVSGLRGGAVVRRQAGKTETVARPPAPSSQQVGLRAPDNSYQLSVPNNWKMIETGGELVIFAPEGAAGKTENGGVVVTHGMFVGTAGLPENARDLGSASKAFIELQLKDNPGMRILENPKQTTLGGLPAVFAPIGGESPITGRPERDVICTAILPDGRLFYLILISPVDEAQVYNQAFEKTLGSLAFGK